jgi:hypothetical protein
MRLIRALLIAMPAASALAACGSPDPGGVVSIAEPSPGNPSAAVTTLAAAPPRPSEAAGAVVPALHKILQRLNEDTAATAQGEELILGELSQALRQQITSLLDTAGHPR